ARASRASALGDRAAIRRTERRAGARSLRGALVHRVAPPYRPHGPGLHLVTGRTTVRRGAPADAARRARRDHRDSHGPLFRHAPALRANHAKTRGNQSANLSGGEMARTGLRMMPTSPSPSLKFRTAGFPQYGFKASLSGATCRPAPRGKENARSRPSPALGTRF